MADRGDTHYHVGSLNRWFVGSSLLLLVSTLWMVLSDWDRPWKGYQREFRALEIQRARTQLDTPEAKAVLAEEERARGELAGAQAALDGHKTELENAEQELRNLKGDRFKATEAEKKAKQVNNWERFLTEEERIHTGDQTAMAGTIKQVEKDLYSLSGTKQEDDAKVAAQEAAIAKMREAVTKAETNLKNAGKSIELTRKKLDTLAPSDMPTQVANVIRDFPGLDFIGPSLKVQKVLPPNLTFELNFTKKPRIDMCQTCHVPIDKEGYASAANPFQTHPRLDLYLTAKSPHPQSDFGCTICHRGAGEALDFQRTDHRPSGDEETERWVQQYGWKKQHYWDYAMLPKRYVEAGCVQCHKSSMELIEADAPKVVEGYHLFERYGCYACHKVDWFPTKRRPAPPLARITQKTTREFIESWVTNPKNFRPTTWMPQIFHLENYGPDVTIATSNYGTGREMKGDEWSDAAVAAVSAFVRSRSTTESLPPIPVQGDATRGREVFRLVGCLACHNLAPFTEEERQAERDPANQRRVTNEHGPNLRGVASKVKPEWLFAWIKDPNAYWSETRMPNLRLSDQDAADVVAYVFDDPQFKDTPTTWKPGTVAYKRDVLEEQARWFWNRDLRGDLEQRFSGEWKDDQELLVALGRKWILAQGCHSCHEIPGLENEQPIGTELSTWASKTVDKLDFGFMPEILAEQHGWNLDQTQEFKDYRENFLEQKLKEPRSYDRRKIKNPTERLRMPWFNFTDSQIESLTCFVAGLVNDEVQHAKMVPTPDKAEMDAGLRVVRQKNCAGCHVLEPAQISFKDDKGAAHSVRGQILSFDEDKLPPPTQDFQGYVASYKKDFELESVIVQLLVPEPGFGDVGDKVEIKDIDSIRVQPPKGGGLVEVITDYYVHEDDELDHHHDVEDVDGQRRSYAEEVYDKLRWTFAPPVLLNEGGKLQREWFYRFLLDPFPLRKQIRTRMPTFHFADGEPGAVADYFANRSKRDWPARYARKLLLAEKQTPEQAAAEMAKRELKSSASVIQGIVDGKPVETATGLDTLMRYGSAVGFAIEGSVDPTYEAIPQRSPQHIGPVLAKDPDFFERVHTLVSKTGGPTCVQCHFLQGAPPTQTNPVAWAPDLDHARERLRPSWTREWLTDPAKIYPGTTMPANFPAGQTQWQELYPAASPDQIEAVLDWLFNLDRATVRN